MSDISVVVCAYDMARWSELRETIRSLEQQILEPSEVVVVVDRNRDLFNRARKALSDVVVVENSLDPGLSGARNSGVAASSGSIVAFLDDDAVASSDWLALLAPYYLELEVAGVGGRAEPVWTTRRPAWFPPEFDWVVGCTHAGIPRYAHEVRNLIGCNMSFRRELLLSLGGFRIGPYCDETELCIRLQQRWPEKKLMYIPQARVFHRVTDDRARFGYFLWRCQFEGGSKAVVSLLAGSRDGLASERHYVRRALPQAVKGGFAQFVSGQDRAGFIRAIVVVLGLGVTTGGYIAGRIAPKRAARRRGIAGKIRA